MHLPAGECLGSPDDGARGHYPPNSSHLPHRRHQQRPCPSSRAPQRASSPVRPGWASQSVASWTLGSAIKPPAAGHSTTAPSGAIVPANPRTSTAQRQCRRLYRRQSRPSVELRRRAMRLARVNAATTMPRPATATRSACRRAAAAQRRVASPRVVSGTRAAVGSNSRWVCIFNKCNQ